jgi:hypothetical protein
MNNENLISLKDFCHVFPVENSLLDHLFESGLIDLVIEDKELFLIRDQIPDLERFIQLYSELEINFPGLEVISHLLPQMLKMMDEIQELKSQVKFYQNWGINPDQNWKEID